MCRNWKGAAALGVTVLLGCMLPMSTMLAAEDDVETETESVYGFLRGGGRNGGGFQNEDLSGTGLHHQ